MKKRIIISVILIILIFFITKCSLMIKESNIEDNLNANSVYYAKNMPHAKDKHPVIVMLIENLEFVKKPKIDGIKYDIDGTNSIHNTNNKNNLEENYITSSYLLEPICYAYNDNKGTHYIFDSNFKLHPITKEVNKNIDLSIVNEQAIIDEIYEFVKPVIDSQTEPEENLQEEFNKRYKDRFN